MTQIWIGKVILTLCISNSAVFGFAPLGSDPVDKCYIHSYQCPSHYICETHDRIVRESSHGHCICDRFYGFYGPTCENISVASYLVAVYCIICFILTSRSLYLNLQFASELHKRGTLQQDTLCRCLLFNILGTFPLLAWEVGYFVGVTSIDRQMFFHEYIRPPATTCLIVTLVLSTMSISLAWIGAAERTRGGPNFHWKYKLLLYGTSVFAFLVSLVSFRYNMTDMVGVCQGIAISFSYFQGKYMVSEALSVMEENGDIVVFHGAADVLHTIKNTSKKMMMYSLLFSFSSAVAGFTMTVPTPKYKKQNHLPRYFQGQICLFMIGICSYQINMALLNYLKSSAKRQLARPLVNRTFWECTKGTYSYLFCCLFGTRCCGLFIPPQHIEAAEISISSLGVPQDLSSKGDKESSNHNSVFCEEPHDGIIPRTQTIHGFGGLHLLSSMISNNSHGYFRAMGKNFPRSQTVVAVNDEKIARKKVVIVPEFQPPMSSEMSSLTEGSRGKANQQNVSKGLNQLSLARAQRREMVIGLDNDSIDDMSSVTMPEALKVAQPTSNQDLMIHHHRDKNINSPFSSSASSLISASSPVGSPPNVSGVITLTF